MYIDASGRKIPLKKLLNQLLFFYFILIFFFSDFQFIVNLRTVAHRLCICGFRWKVMRKLKEKDRIHLTTVRSATNQGFKIL